MGFPEMITVGSWQLWNSHDGDILRARRTKDPVIPQLTKLKIKQDYAQAKCMSDLLDKILASRKMFEKEVNVEATPALNMEKVPVKAFKNHFEEDLATSWNPQRHWLSDAECAGKEELDITNED